MATNLTSPVDIGPSTFTPLSMLDVKSGTTPGVAIGSYAGSTAAPDDGLIVSGFIGAGTGSPGLAAHVVGPSGFPANSGATQTGMLRLQGATSNGVLDFSVAGGTGASLQSTNQTNLGINYDLLLNPNGGSVGVGTGTSNPPGLPTHLVGALGFPASSGSTQTGVLRLQGAGSNGVLDLSVNGSSGSSLQSTNGSALGSIYPLLLNPNGGNVGVGTGTTNPPGLPTHLVGALGFPASSGSTQTGVLRLQGAGSNGVLDFSVDGGSGASLQVTNQTALGTDYPLLLNPNGGDVSIGSSSSGVVLDVTGTVEVSSLSVGGIVKSSAGVLAIATAGTDYTTPSEVVLAASVPVSSTLISNASGTIINTSDVFNVKAYGATGNGSTDDTYAINQAINALIANTHSSPTSYTLGTLYFPAGTYKISAQLAINLSSLDYFTCVIKGDGRF